ncbi:hypothetical protein [uncultured Acinetobacter sp.]|uniref:hypothetical protein n=1 Tax=uncultured Acinetobacter sp. TaxID=165433 RepID=UPI00258945FF|nr:hypothetical protein [uncultured Acinetobacter sp.]
MPKIELLTDLCSGPAGSIIDVQDYEFDVLQRLGVAKLADSTNASEQFNGQTIFEPIELKGLLLNLNGTPVVDDFGALVPEVAIQKVQKSANKGGKNTKKGE